MNFLALWLCRNAVGPKAISTFFEINDFLPRRERCISFVPIIAIPKYIGIIVKVIVVVIILVIVAVDDTAAAATAAIKFIIFADVKVLVACKCFFC